MASTYSNLGIDLQGTGDNSGTWGQVTNVNLQELDAAIAGVAPITLTGNTTLAFTSNSSSTTYVNESGRNKVVVLSGSLSATTVTVTVPNIQKDYVIVNNTGATVIVSSGGSTTVTIPTTTNAYIYSNGSSSIFFALPLATAGLSIGGTTNAVQYNNAGALAGSTNLTFNGTTLAIQTATALNLTVTTDNISTANINTANVTTLKVTSITIYSTITATSVVTSASLVPTGVTSGSYTAASITVGSDGRITSASSGSGGAGMAIPNLFASGPSTGTYTANPAANRLGVYMSAGGSGGGYCGSASGGYGFWNYPISSPSKPFSQPYTVGYQGGPQRNGGGGTPGGPTNLTNVGTANAGCSPNVTPGNQPGSYYTGYDRRFIFGYLWGQGGGGTTSSGPIQGSPAYPGVIAVFENTGT